MAEGEGSHHWLDQSGCVNQKFHRCRWITRRQYEQPMLVMIGHRQHGDNNGQRQGQW